MKAKLIYSVLFIFWAAQLSTAQIKINGRITDCEGEPLLGALVAIKNTKKSTVSNNDGYYNIVVPGSNSVIKYSYVGFISQEIKVGNKDTVNVSLKFNDSWDDTILVKKPVIYLYPTEEQKVSLDINYSGKLGFTYPEYDNGWHVIASPDGTLINQKDNKKYAYLFWDGEQQYNAENTVYETGFVVNRVSVVSFLEEKLKQFALTPKEYNEFIVFWTPYLLENEWNFIHFRLGKDYEVISKNIVHPKPDTEIRVFMDFKGIDAPFEVSPQIPPTTPTRKGFTLVEWGGAELTQPIKVKTTHQAYIKK